MKDIVNDINKSDTWKIQLTIESNFISFKDTDEECVMHSKSDNIEFMTYDNALEVIEELFASFRNRYKIGLQISMCGSDFIFSFVHLLYYKCHKINPDQCWSYIDSSNWIKNVKPNINPMVMKSAFNIL